MLGGRSTIGYAAKHHFNGVYAALQCFTLQILGKCTGNAFYKYYIFSLMKNYLEKCSLLRPKGLNPFQTFFRFFFVGQIFYLSG